MNILIDSTGTNLYVSDSINYRVTKWAGLNSSFGIVIAGGNGIGNSARMTNVPWGLSLNESSNTMFIINYGGHTIQKWHLGDQNGTFLVGTPGISGSNASQLYNPSQIIVDSFGNLYVSDTSNHRIQMFHKSNSYGTGITIAGVTGSAGSTSQRHVMVLFIC
ncbi:unnamed protein product [Didymodactylos carnosus]|uniref:NHL repeat containing protein n=1 Tax=Didymodactylos carnosus TaxID=1234261 RepID=A0A815NWK6_9BILA|nr:unnamed protein product [Didymodactylos carnosus]CAF4316904.1 unnamed protein product [Didymodactylos carnosus]